MLNFVVSGQQMVLVNFLSVRNTLKPKNYWNIEKTVNKQNIVIAGCLNKLKLPEKSKLDKCI